MNKPTIITPAEQVIDVARARLQCKIAGTDRDTELTDAIAAARAYAEAYIGLPIGDQVREYRFDCWPGRATLPCDIVALVAVTAAGESVTPLPSPTGRTLTFAATAPVTIRIRCGWTSSTLPSDVKMAMLLLISDYIRNPQAQSDVQLWRNSAVDDLLAAERESWHA